MQTTVNSVLEAAFQLPEDDRRTLLSKLIEAVPIDDKTLSLDDPNLADELERRFLDDAGAIPWTELETER
jgi:hypothetical protein